MRRPMLLLPIVALFLVACGGAPTRTENSTSETFQQTDGGGQVTTTTTATSETQPDGTQTSETTVTTETSPAQQ